MVMKPLFELFLAVELFSIPLCDMVNIPALLILLRLFLATSRCVGLKLADGDLPMWPLETLEFFLILDRTFLDLDLYTW